MDRNTDLKNMDAPGVGSGKDAGETILKGLASYPSSSEKGSNELKEYSTPAMAKGNLGGKAKH